MSRSAVTAGDVIDIRARGLITACNDTGQSGPLLGEPPADIEVRIVQHHVVTPLARVDANRDYEFAVRVMVPRRLEPGPAEIRAGRPNHGFLSVAVVVAPAAAVPAHTASPPTVLVGTASQPAAAEDHNRRWLIAGFLLALSGTVATLAFVVRRRRAAFNRG